MSDKLADELCTEYGWDNQIQGKQIKKRWSRLVNRYNTVNEATGKSGSSGTELDWPLYNIVAEAMSSVVMRDPVPEASSVVIDVDNDKESCVSVISEAEAPNYDNGQNSGKSSQHIYDPASGASSTTAGTSTPGGTGISPISSHTTDENQPPAKKSLAEFRKEFNSHTKSSTHLGLALKDSCQHHVYGQYE